MTKVSSPGWVDVRPTIRYFVLILLCLLSAASMSPSVAGQGIGFQASLLTPSTVVSPYDAPNSRFSAALYPKTSYAFPSMTRVPSLEESSFDNNSLNFVLKLNQRVSMVPVSTDAKQYLNYRVTKFVRSTKDSLVQQSLRASHQQKGRGGISIGVPLPKRVERLVGEGGGNLSVSGIQQISFSGRSTWRDGANTDLIRQSKFPSLNMDQISRFEISGTVGSKISVRVSQDNQTDIPLANRIQIRYKGDQDDILRTVEAGNTTLSLPNTRFIGYSRSIQGLFGIKTEAQIGGLKLTMIASQEKGTSEHASVSATTEQGAKIIRDAQYADGRIFDLGGPGDAEPLQRYDSIFNLRVFEERRADSTQLRFATCYRDPLSPADSNFMERYRVTELSSTPLQGMTVPYYQWFDDSTRSRHYLVFITSHTTWGISVSYQIRRRAPGGDTIITVGREVGNELVLKKIRAQSSNFVPSDPTWNMMWRNCYEIPMRSTVEDLDMKIFKGLPGDEQNTQNLSYQPQEGATRQSSYLTILGIDLYNKQNQRLPDDRVDEIKNIFRSDWGLLIFPHRFPFNTDTSYQLQGYGAPPLEDTVPDLYNNQGEARWKNSKYYIRMSAKTRSSIIRLNRVNIIPGSERVTLNGRQLQKDVDYQISYEIGQLTLLKEDALDPNAQLAIDFEYAPFLALQKKTLFGMRAEYEVNQNLRFGTTFLYKSDKAEERKPRVGQETARGTVAGFDFALNLYPKFLTKAVNALPFIATDVRSAMSISGEVAQSRPNPNVTGVAYIDDFEGTVEQVSIGLSRVGWRLCSPPLQMKQTDKGGADSVMQRRGRLLWYSPGTIPWEDVYKGQRKQGEGLIQVFRLVYRPNTTGLGPERPTAPGYHWAGVQSVVRPLDDARLRLFEIRVHGNKGILHFDIGRISEDVNNNNEDDNSENADFNDHVTPSEDVGMDNIPDSLEKGYNADTLPDPNRDDFRSYVGASSNDYSKNLPPVSSRRLTDAFRDSVIGANDVLRYDWINGTEGNLKDPAAGDAPDKEAQVGTSMQRQNDYYAYHVNLASDTFLVDSSENAKGWKTYRIPIRDSAAMDTTFGAPLKWNQVNYVRAWLESPEADRDTVTVDVANWYFVQSSWNDTIMQAVTSPRLTDTTGSRFYVASVSDQENSNFKPAPGVVAYYDKTNNVTEAQKAMALVYDSVYPSDTCMAVKELLSVDRYTGYRRLKMYVHGPTSARNDTIMFIFRLGLDAKNFYEFHTKLDTGWAEGNYVDLDFNAITAFKDTLLRYRDSTTLPGNIDSSSGSYRVRGSPNFNQIRYLAAGLVNKGSSRISGEVWVDELRVTDVRADVGTAARIDVGGSLADLVTYGVSYESRDPYFRGLAAATRGGSDNNLGSGNSQKTFGWNFSIGLGKFLPQLWNAQLPVSVNYSRSEQLPLLATNSDIILPSEARRLERSTSERRGISFSESMQKKSRNPLFGVLLNRQRMSFSYTRSLSEIPVMPYSFNEQYSVHGEYEMGYADLKAIPIFFWTKPVPLLNRLASSKLAYYPGSWHWSGTYNRVLTINEDNKRNRRSSFSRTLDGSMNLEYKMFQNISLGFTYNTRRDLSDTADVRLKLNDLHLGQELSYNQSFRTGWSPLLFKFLSTNYTFSSTYNDSYDRQAKTKQGDLSTTWSIGGQFQHLLLIGGSGRGGSTPQPSKLKPGEKPKSSSAPVYEYPRRWLRLLTGWIKPVNYRYQRTFTGSVPGMVDRPRMVYRLGLSHQANVPIASQSSSQPLSAEAEQYEFSSGFTFLGGVGLDIKLRRDVNRDLVKVGDRTQRVSSGWPDMSIRIQPFRTLPLFKGVVNKFIQVFTPSTSYSRQVREESNLTRGFLTSRTITIARSPMLAVTFKAFRALSLTGTYGRTTTESELFSSVDGHSTSISRSRQSTLGISSQYSFSAPGGIGLPLLGKLKFRSQMQLSTDIRFNSTYTESGVRGLPIAKGRDNSEFSVSENIAYQFSSQIKGGMTARWTDSRDASDNKSHIRELRLWAEIRF